MKRFSAPLLLPLALLCLALPGFATLAQQSEPAEADPPQESPAEHAAPRAATDADAEEEEQRPPRRTRRSRSHQDRVIVRFGQDSHLPADDEADVVVSILGSARVEGAVDEDVVAIFGDARIEGPVRDNAVAVFGDTYIDARIGENAVAVFGNLTLGPNAQVDGDVVAFGGTITRDAAAVVYGDSSEITVGTRWGRLEGLRTWINECLFYGRPLAFEPGLGWAWGVALTFLALYIAMALLFSAPVEKCVETFERQPAQTVIASLLAVLLTPVLMLLLVVSVIGIAVIPLVGMLIVCAMLFGKAVVLAALGRRITRFTGIAPFSHVAFATLVGGLIVLGLYVVPVLGLIAFKLLGILGLGVVVYTVLLALQQRQAESARTAREAAPAAAAAAGAAAPFAEPQTPGNPHAGSAAAQDEARPRAAEPPPDPATLPRAGFWIRMGALLVDVVLVSIVVSLLDPLGDIVLLALAAYGAIMWKLKGTTVGGIVFGLRVIGREGGEISWDVAVVRALGCFLSLIAAGLGFIWIAIDPEKRAWHDRIAGTLVVRVPRT